jgi:hypothetical protein
MAGYVNAQVLVTIPHLGATVNDSHRLDPTEPNGTMYGAGLGRDGKEELLGFVTGAPARKQDQAGKETGSAQWRGRGDARGVIPAVSWPRPGPWAGAVGKGPYSGPAELTIAANLMASQLGSVGRRRPYPVAGP